METDVFLSKLGLADEFLVFLWGMETDLAYLARLSFPLFLVFLWGMETQKHARGHGASRSF